jgi:hypothetical protein
MDQHLQFRISAMKQSSSLLGRRPQRLPLSTPPPARTECDGGTMDWQDGFSENCERPQVRARRRVERGANPSPKVKAQVNQLKFWLKVFSRFCHDESEHGEV